MSGPHAPGFYALTNKSDKSLKYYNDRKICEKIVICYSGTTEQSEPYSLLLNWPMTTCH